MRMVGRLKDIVIGAGLIATGALMIDFSFDKGAQYFTEASNNGKRITVMYQRIFPGPPTERGVAEVYLNREVDDTLKKELMVAIAKLAEAAQRLKEGKRVVLDNKHLEVLLQKHNASKEVSSAVDSVALYSKADDDNSLGSIMRDLSSLILLLLAINGALLSGLGLAKLWSFIK